MAFEIENLERLIRSGVKSFPVGPKSGNELQAHVGGLLAAEGYQVDLEDTRGFLRWAEPVWRDKRTGEIVPTPGRRRIDIVVRESLNGPVVALIEIESDLNDLRASGVSNRSGNYDVFSISRDQAGQWFHSYKSIERMAAAAFYCSGGTLQDLEFLSSNSPEDHNPTGLGILVVTGISRAIDRKILAPRLGSLGARLISLVERN
ncbi:MAG: hypothetical protein ACO38S_04885 [Gemmobacter sp.]